MIRVLVLVLVLVARVAAAQVTAPQVRAQFDSAGQAQRYTDPSGAWWTFTATRTDLGVIRLLADGSPATPAPLVLTVAVPVVVPPLATDVVTVATAVYLITGQTATFPPTGDRFRLAVRWGGTTIKDGDPPASAQAVVSPWAVSTETFTLVVTDTPPTTGTFTILGGPVTRAPRAPGVLLVLQASRPSPDGTRLPPATQIVDNDGTVWTMSGTSILRNGQSAAGGTGNLLTWCGGQIRTYDAGAKVWYRWTGVTWVGDGFVDPCVAGNR